jgi:hypothetical protein
MGAIQTCLVVLVVFFVFFHLAKVYLAFTLVRCLLWVMF